MKKFTILITAMLLFIFTGEAQTNFKSKNLKSGNLKIGIKKQIKKINSGFNPDGYCAASSSQCDEYIQRVQIGSIDNTTACNNYADYTSLSTTIPGNYYDVITVTNGSTQWNVDECGIWVDWNNDEDFDDSGEAITVSGSPGTGPYTATIAPDWPNIPQGDYRMRIRITYGQTPTPCGTDSYGEVEDYTIHIGPSIDNVWVGAYGYYWDNDNNWSLGHKPTADENVVITNSGYQPVQSNSDAACNNLTIQSGELNVLGSYLTVSGNIAISGKLSMTFANSQIACYGNVDWNNNSTANFSSYSTFYVQGHWFFNTGTNAHLDNGIVEFFGTGTSQFKCKSPTSSIYDLYFSKTAPGEVSVAADANYPFVVNGTMYIFSGNTLYNGTNQDIICRGANFINYGYFDFTLNNNTSTFVFDGTSQNFITDNNYGIFNNVKISPSTYVAMYGDIHIAGNLTIEQGMLDSQGHNITIEGNWNNQVGSSGFNETGSRVTFYTPPAKAGKNSQYCSSETFDTLEINNASGEMLTISNATVICNHYDWTAGGINVLSGGIFSAGELTDDGIYGKFYLSPGGAINLTNNGGWVDLNGELNISGGTMTVYGGTTASYWPYDADADLTMSGGVLEFHDQGIYINELNNDLTADITGGTIRSAGDFIITPESDVFAPTGGTVKMIGTSTGGGSPYHISMTADNNFYNLKIDNSVTGINIYQSDVTVAGDLTIENGTFQCEMNQSYKLYVGGDWSDYLKVFDCEYGEVVFNGSGASSINHAEDFYDLTVNKTSSGTVTLSGETTIFNNLTISSGVLVTGNNPIILEGNWNNNVGPAAFDEGYGLVTFSGNVPQSCSTEDFYTLHIGDNAKLNIQNGQTVTCQSLEFDNTYYNGEIYVADGTFTAWDLSDFEIRGNYYLTDENAVVNLHQDEFQEVNLAADIDITAGEMNIYSDSDYDSKWGSNDGSVIMLGGILNFVNNGIELVDQSTYSLYTNITGGTIKTKGDFKGGNENFNPTGGTVELYGSKPTDVGITYIANGEEQCYFYDLVINKGANGSATSVEDFLVKRNLNVQAGLFDVAGQKIKADTLVDIYGTLKMMNPAGKLTANMIYWKSGSEDIVDAGEFYTQYFSFENGTNAKLGTGNTVTTFYINGDDADAEFGNLILTLTFISKNNDNTPKGCFPSDMVYNKSGNKQILKTDSSKYLDYYRIYVKGDLTFQSYLPDTYWGLSGPWQFTVEGTLNIEDQFALWLFKNSGSTEPSITTYSDFMLNGTLGLDSALCIVEGDFDIAQTGELFLKNGSNFQVVTDPSDETTLNGTLEMEGGVFESTNNSIVINDTTDISGGTIKTGKSFEVNSLPGLFQPTGGTVETHIVAPGSCGDIALSTGNAFYNLTINNGQGLTTHYANEIAVTNDLSILSGKLECGINSPSDPEISVGGDWYDNPSGFISNQGTVSFFNAGTGPSHLYADETFYNLTVDQYLNKDDPDTLYIPAGLDVSVSNDLRVDNGGIIMGMSYLSIDNDFYLLNNAFFKVLPAAQAEINIGGNWNNLNTANTATKGFSPGLSTVTFYGNNNQEFYSSSTSLTNNFFNKFMVDKNTGILTLHSGLVCNGEFRVTSGSVIDNFGCTSDGHSFYGDFIIEENGQVDFSEHILGLFGPSNTLFSDVSSNNNYYGATIFVSKDSPSTTVSFIGNLSTELCLILSQGYAMALTSINCTYLKIYDGTFYMGEGITLSVEESVDVSSGGTFEIEGSASNPAIVTKPSGATGGYDFSVNSGGTISAEYTVFEYMGTPYGINIKQGAIVSPDNCFTACEFKNGDPFVTDGALLTLNNDQDLTLDYCSFPTMGTDYNVRKDVNTGTVSFTNFTGAFSGWDYEKDPNSRIYWEGQQYSFSLKTFLQGPYNPSASGMNTGLAGFIPLNQPFNTNPNADWYYTGPESVSSIPANVVDWVLVQLRDAANAGSAGSSTVIAQQAAFLLNDGSIVDLDGTSNLTFSGMTYTSSLYPVVWHKNHLGVLSATALTRVGDTYSYDFTTSNTQAYGTNAQIDLGNGVYGMRSGDGNGDGDITIDDINNVWKIQAGTKGYKASDFNMNSQVDNKDKNDKLVPNFGKGSFVPE